MGDRLSKDAVLAYLKAHPDVLADLFPAPQDKTETVVDFQHHLIDRLRTTLDERTADHSALVDASRGNLASQQQVHNAVLAIMRAGDMDALARIFAHELPDILRVDMALLCLDRRQGSQAGRDGVRALAPTVLNTLLDADQSVRLSVVDHASDAVFGPAANLIKSQAVMRLDPGEGFYTVIFVLGDRHANTFEPGQGTQLLRFLGDVVSIKLQQILPAVGQHSGAPTQGFHVATWSKPDS